MNYFIDMIKAPSLAFTWVWRDHGQGADGSLLLLQVLRGFMAVALICWVVVIFFTPLAASAGSAAQPCLLKEGHRRST